ncbi:MAG: hypothetical protein KJ622_02580 [Alphaproteobacteria bacterium]|nr:hypothetical protein [Alphaproteobacteria bacterium]
MSITVGLDVGGAHLKVARLENGTPVDVRQFASPLWQGFDRLGVALGSAVPMLGGARQVAVTMTGELSDLFECRALGVRRLCEFLTQGFGDKARFYLGNKGFGSAEDAMAAPDDAGSMNFLATAEVIGLKLGEAILIDFGSTTVDIIAITDGVPAVRGFSDAYRQASGELVYTGLTRTAVMGVAQRAPLRGRFVGLSREHLATMADVRRILGWDLEGIDLHQSADGRGKTIEESRARLARMFGCDAEQATPEEWRTAAAYLREAQLNSVVEGVLQVLSAAVMPDDAPIIAAGIGAAEASEVSRRLRRPCQSFGEFLALDGAIADAATHHAPAVAVANLLESKTALRPVMQEINSAG